MSLPNGDGKAWMGTTILATYTQRTMLPNVAMVVATLVAEESVWTHCG